MKTQFKRGDKGTPSKPTEEKSEGAEVVNPAPVPVEELDAAPVEEVEAVTVDEVKVPELTAYTVRCASFTLHSTGKYLTQNLPIALTPEECEDPAVVSCVKDGRLVPVGK